MLAGPRTHPPVQDWRVVAVPLALFVGVAGHQFLAVGGQQQAGQQGFGLAARRPLALRRIRFNQRMDGIPLRLRDDGLMLAGVVLAFVVDLAQIHPVV